MPKHAVFREAVELFAGRLGLPYEEALQEFTAMADKIKECLVLDMARVLAKSSYHELAVGMDETTGEYAYMDCSIRSSLGVAGPPRSGKSVLISNMVRQAEAKGWEIWLSAAASYYVPSVPGAVHWLTDEDFDHLYNLAQRRGQRLEALGFNRFEQLNEHDPSEKRILLVVSDMDCAASGRNMETIEHFASVGRYYGITLILESQFLNGGSDVCPVSPRTLADMICRVLTGNSNLRGAGPFMGDSYGLDPLPAYGWLYWDEGYGQVQKLRSFSLA